MREVQKAGAMDLLYCKTKDQVADIFIKPMSVNKFEFFRKTIGMCNI